jgi:hypothetical protein
MLKPATMEKYVIKARPILVKVAKGGWRDKYITYKELQSEMHGPGLENVGNVLEEVSFRAYKEHDEQGKQREIILSAVVVSKSKSIIKKPGLGFWKLNVFPPSLRDAAMEHKISRWEEEYKKTCEYCVKHNI